jgi:hypothetical protein
MAKRPTFETSVDTRLLYQHLLTIKPGDTVTYAKLSEIISRPVVGSTPQLQSAIRRALREDGLVFGNISKVGYKHLLDPEIVDAAGNDVSTIRRRAKRSVGKLLKVQDFTTLDKEHQVKHSTAASIFGFIHAFLAPKAIKSIRGGVEAAGKELPIAETIKMFSKN